MAKKKTRKQKMWSVWCGICDVTIEFPVESIHSTDQGAEFLIKPTVECGKCFSGCMVELKEPDDGKEST